MISRDMNSFNFVNYPILIVGYSICLLFLVLSFIKAIKFNWIFIIALYLVLVGLSIYSLLMGTTYQEVICFILIFFVASLVRLIRRKESA